MKKIFWIILVVSAGIFGFMSFVKPVGHHDSQGVKEVWYCPMHPHYTSDQPGTCPICGMDLVKRKTESIQKADHSPRGYSTVSLSPSQAQLINLKTVKAQHRSLVKDILAFGSVAHDLDLYNAQLEYIDAWRQFFSYSARRGVVVDYKQDWREYYSNPSTRWNSEDLRRSQQRLTKAEYELKHMGLTEGELEKLRFIKNGQPWVQPELLVFDRSSSVWVYAEIFSSDIGYVDVGQKVIVDVPDLQESYEGIIRTVSDIVDPIKRTVRVRIELLKKNIELKVNLFVNVRMSVELNDGVIIPKEAVMDTGLRKIVFVVKSKGVLKPQEIQLTMDGGKEVLVRKGIKEGDEVVVDGNFLIDSESRMKADMLEVSHD